MRLQETDDRDGPIIEPDVPIIDEDKDYEPVEPVVPEDIEDDEEDEEEDIDDPNKLPIEDI